MNWMAILTLLVSLLALAASAFFSAAESAIFSTRPQSLKNRRKNDPRVQRIGEVLAEPRKFLVTLLLGNVFANALVAMGFTFFFFYQQHEVVWWKLILTVTVLLLIFGELLPKAIATQKASTLALMMVTWLRRLEKIAHPVVNRLDALSQQWAGWLSPFSMKPLHGLTEDEYVTMLDVGTREGALRPAERRLIEKTLHLADRNLRELMTPRMDMHCLDSEKMDLDQIKTQAASMKHRRLPIYSDSPDSIVGVLNVRRFLLDPNFDVIASIEPPAFVPETMSALELLKSFLRGPQRMAMVMDEFGGVEGLITLEDIVEEVFGEIYDEYDEAQPLWEEIERNVYVVRGSASLMLLSEWLKIDLETDGVDTLAGWMIEKIGSLPKVGDQVSYQGCVFSVEKMDRLRIRRILLKDQRRIR